MHIEHSTFLLMQISLLPSKVCMFSEQKDQPSVKKNQAAQVTQPSRMMLWQFPQNLTSSTTSEASKEVQFQRLLHPELNKSPTFSIDTEQDKKYDTMILLNLPGQDHCPNFLRVL